MYTAEKKPIDRFEIYYLGCIGCCYLLPFPSLCLFLLVSWHPHSVVIIKVTCNMWSLEICSINWFSFDILIFGYSLSTVEILCNWPGFLGSSIVWRLLCYAFWLYWFLFTRVSFGGFSSHWIIDSRVTFLEIFVHHNLSYGRVYICY